MHVSYVSSRGKRSFIDDVISTDDSRFTAAGKLYRIDHAGRYPLLQVCCSGSANTYWRTIGKYPNFVLPLSE